MMDISKCTPTFVPLSHSGHSSRADVVGAIRMEAGRLGKNSRQDGLGEAVAFTRIKDARELVVAESRNLTTQ